MMTKLLVYNCCYYSVLTDTLENNPLTFYHIKLSFMIFKHMLFETKSLEENGRINNYTTSR